MFDFPGIKWASPFPNGGDRKLWPYISDPSGVRKFWAGVVRPLADILINGLFFVGFFLIHEGRKLDLPGLSMVMLFPWESHRMGRGGIRLNIKVNKGKQFCRFTCLFSLHTSGSPI